MNSDRKNKNNWNSIKSSPMGPLAHTHAEHNTFNIAFKGKRLFIIGYRPWMGAPHTLAWYKHTQDIMVLVDQKGQLYDAGSYGFIRDLLVVVTFHAVGDASCISSTLNYLKVRKDNTPNDKLIF